METQSSSNIEMVAVSDLKPYEKNARTHSKAQVEQIAASIREFGWTNPVLIKDDLTIIAGHGRVMAAKSMGQSEVPCIRLSHLTDAQVQAYVIADNKLATNAGWDEEILAAELQALADQGFQLDVIGFSDRELNALLTDNKEGLTDPDDVPEVDQETVTVAGDVWLLGNHRVVCGDATSPTDWDKLKIGRPSLVFTSPPYGLGENARLRDHYEPGSEKRNSLYSTHDDNPEGWPDLMRSWTNNAISRSDCIVCNIQTLANNKRRLVEWSAEYVNHIIDVAIWDKGHGAPQMQRNVLTNSFEWLFILSPDENPSRSLPLADFHGTEGNVVRVGKGLREFADVHRATMPVELAEWAIRSVGPRADYVVDPFGGTGTTLIAAEKHGKRSCLIEMDPKYCDVIVERWQNFTGEVAVNERTGLPFSESVAAKE